MQLRIGSKVALLLGDNKKAATIEGFNGFTVSLLLDEDGTKIASVDLSRLVPADVDASHNENTTTFLGYDLGLQRDDNARIMAFERGGTLMSTITANVRVWYKSIAAVKQNVYVRWRQMKESLIYSDNFPSNTLTDNWKYIAGTTGWSVSSAHLVNSGANLGHVIVPNYGANYWYSHGVQFTLVSGTSFQLAAAIEGGVMLLDFLSGTSATLSYLADGESPLVIQTVTFSTTVTAADVITMFSFNKIVQVRKNNNIVAQFTNPVPGAVKSAWGFGDKYAVTISNFNLLGKAQGTEWFLPIHYTVQAQGSTQQRFEPNEQNRVGLLDSNLSHFAFQQIKVSYHYTPQPKVVMPIAFKMLGQAIKGLNFRYATKISITKTAAVSYGLKKSLSQTVATVYKVKVAIKQSALLLYKLKVPTTGGVSVSYRYKKAVTPLLLPVIYGLKGSPGQVAVVSYAVRGLVGRSLVQFANMRGIANQVLTEIANSKQIAASSLSEKANVNGATAKTLTELAGAFQLAGASLTEKANARQLAGANLMEKVNAAQAIAKTLIEQGNVLGITAQTLTEDANVSGLAAQTLTDVSNILVVTAKALTEVANARQAIAQTRTEKANINNDLAQTLTEVANVLATLVRTLTEQGNVHANVVKSVAIKYHLYLGD